VTQKEVVDVNHQESINESSAVKNKNK